MRQPDELADGTTHEYPFGLVEIRFIGEVTAGGVAFGPDDVDSLLGVTALESVGITVDPANRTLKRLPAIPLKEHVGRGGRRLDTGGFDIRVDLLYVIGVRSWNL
jgi:hypothetical protein